MRPIIVGSLAVLLGACDAPTRPDGGPAPGPVPTLSLNGLVHDTIGRPIPDVRIEVGDGPRAGLSTTSDAEGRFTLANVADDSTSELAVTASKPGYVAHTSRFRNINRRPLLFFQLESEIPPLDLRGSYRVTFTADRACTMLPESVRTREYSAQLRESGSSHLTALEGAVFGQPPPVSSGAHSDWNDLLINLFQNTAALSTGDPGIWEHMTPQTFITITGNAQGELSESPYILPLEGTFSYCGDWNSASVDAPDCRIQVATCASKNHTVMLERIHEP